MRPGPVARLVETKGVHGILATRDAAREQDDWTEDRRNTPSVHDVYLGGVCRPSGNAITFCRRLSILVDGLLTRPEIEA